MISTERMPVSSRSSRSAALAGSSSSSMPPCGICHQPPGPPAHRRIGPPPDPHQPRGIEHHDADAGAIEQRRQVATADSTVAFKQTGRRGRPSSMLMQKKPPIPSWRERLRAVAGLGFRLRRRLPARRAASSGHTAAAHPSPAPSAHSRTSPTSPCRPCCSPFRWPRRLASPRGRSRRLGLQLWRQLLLDHHVRLDALGLDGSARRGVVARGRQPDRAVLRRAE